MLADLLSNFLFVLLQFFLVLFDHVLHISKVTLKDAVLFIEDALLEFLSLVGLFFQLFDSHDQPFVGAGQSWHYFLEFAYFEMADLMLADLFIAKNVVHLVKGLALEWIIVL